MGVRVDDRPKCWSDFELECLARKIDLAAMDGNRTRAHWVIDEFFNTIDDRKKTVLKLTDHVTQLVSPMTAWALEAAGFSTINSVAKATDAEILGSKQINGIRLREIRDALTKHGFLPQAYLHTPKKKDNHTAKLGKPNTQKNGRK